MTADVLIIGAGAAGLAAAGVLVRAGCSVILVEARQRVGGRCWSRIDPRLPVPVEMGAEFIHGRPRATLERLERAGIEVLERGGARWLAREGRLVPSDRAALFGEVQRAMLANPLRRDMPFRAYLDCHLGSSLSPGARELALRMAEGYDAAHPDVVSARSLIAEWTGEGTANDVSFRPRGGYGVFMTALAREIVESGGALALGHAVRTIAWRRGRVVATGVRRGRSFRLSAGRAIVTLPVGVLQARPAEPGAVRFAPALAQKRRPLEQLVAGPVLRVTMRFRTAFWERLDGGRYRDAGFLQSVDAPFATYWTSLPARVPLIVAWAGGSRVGPMAQLSAAAVKRRAVESVNSLFGRYGGAAARPEAIYFHDWQRDPFARGAYAYVRTGGGRARRALGAPLDATLYFAGEATDCLGEAGTVAGALQSGERAAHEVLADAG